MPRAKKQQSSLLGRIGTVRRWTRDAEYCYSIGCNCEICEIKDLFEQECQMKAAVLESVRIFGKPFERRKNTID